MSKILHSPIEYLDRLDRTFRISPRTKVSVTEPDAEFKMVSEEGLAIVHIKIGEYHNAVIVIPRGALALFKDPSIRVETEVIPISQVKLNREI